MNFYYVAAPERDVTSKIFMLSTFFYSKVVVAPFNTKNSGRTD